MAYEFKAQRRVEFSDTDMAGIMHFSNFFRFMETAEHGFFRSLGFSIFDTARQPRVGWPRVHASCDYHKPLRFEDECDVTIRIVAIADKSIRYTCEITRGDDRIATGAITVVCVRLQPGGAMKAVSIPGEIASRFASAVGTHE